MKRFPILFLALLTTLVAAPLHAQTRGQQAKTPITQLPPQAKRWALVIGVDNYKDASISPLKGAVNDAKAIADALVEYAGFPKDQVILLASDQPEQRQPTRTEILRRLSNLNGLIPSDGLLLISFAGHGFEKQGRSFLFPSDAIYTEDVNLAQQTALEVSLLRNMIRDTGVRQVMLILDACRNDPFAGRAVSGNPMTTTFRRSFDFDLRNSGIQAFVTLYASSVNQRSYEYAEKKQGFFTWFLVEGLKGKAANERGEVTLASLVRYVEEKVPLVVQRELGSNAAQIPFHIIEGYRTEQMVLAFNPELVRKAMPVSLPEAPRLHAVYLSITPVPANAPLINLPADFSPPPPVKVSASNMTTATVDRILNRSYDQLQRHHFEQLNTALDKITQLDPNNVLVHRIRAEYFSLSQNGVRALEEANLVIAKLTNPQSAKDYEAIGFALLSKGEVDQALRCLSLAISLEPDFATAYCSRGYAYIYKKNYDQAIADFNEAIRLAVTFALAFNGRGFAYSQKQNSEQAIADFNEAIRWAPTFAAAYGNRGDVRSNRQDYALAVADYTEELRLDPQSLWADRSRSNVYKALDLLTQGEKTEAQLSDNQPNNSESFKRVSAGVLSGLALRKVQPPYPAIAKGAKAQGAVQVIITISEEGKVIEAKAVSGHPLLWAAAEAAARQWTFMPTTLQGKPVKVGGPLTFNFLLQ